jgi:hypothetical protein
MVLSQLTAEEQSILGNILYYAVEGDPEEMITLDIEVI